MKRIGILTACLLFGIILTFAQGKAEISVSEKTYNFGTIYEEDGDAIAEFIITNTGTAPLELLNVTASCGCTKPTWTKEPIAPGKTGTVKVTYIVKGRPGPFSRSANIFSNAQEGPFSVIVRGEVVSKASADLQPRQTPVSIESNKVIQTRQAVEKENTEKENKATEKK